MQSWVKKNQPKMARQELCAGACLLQEVKTAKEENPRQLNTVILKILGESKLLKTPKDLTSYHKGC